MIAARSKLQRFSLLLLSEGEYFFDDFRAVRRDNSNSRGKMDKGSLKICSSSIMFVPDDIALPIARKALLRPLFTHDDDDLMCVG